MTTYTATITHERLGRIMLDVVTKDDHEAVLKAVQYIHDIATEELARAEKNEIWCEPRALELIAEATQQFIKTTHQGQAEGKGA